MTPVKLIEFHPKHLELMDIRADEMMGTFKLKDAYDRIEHVWKGSLAAGTFMLDGRVLFCAGFHQLWPGSLEIWMIPSVHVKKAPVAFGRTVRRFFDNIVVDFKAHRIQTTSYDDAFHTRWMQWMGFQKEGTLRKFTHDKKNMCIYAWVEGEK